MRFTTLATVLVALDSLVTIGLWLAGGDSQYLENSVEEVSCSYFSISYYTLIAASSKLEKKSLRQETSQFLPCISPHPLSHQLCLRCSEGITQVHLSVSPVRFTSRTLCVVAVVLSR